MAARTPRGLTSVALVALAVPALAACTTHAPATIQDPPARPSDWWPLGAGCDAQPDPHCTNIVNRVMVPLYRGSNLTIVDESKSELCRRMALDLVGRVPTTEEATRCQNETVEQMADRFMALPEYVQQQQRNWGERFYNLDEQWHQYAVEVDDMVERLYREHIKYDEFMTRLLVHPGFYATFRGDDWASNVVRYALGRNARADEVAALRPLSRAWHTRRFCSGTVWWNVRTGRNGTNERADGQCGRDEFAINFCRCRDDDGASTCATNAFGAAIDFGTDGCVNPRERDSDTNALRVTDVGAGQGPVCPGLPFYNQCQDRDIGDDGPTTQLRRLAGINDGQRQRLYSLGRALAQRPDFWEGAVDRELKRFLDWWQAGLRKPDFDIPLVRTVLAEELRRTGSLRYVQRLIVTSLLYSARAELAPGEADPPSTHPVWAMGPTRIMTAERWLDSVFYVTFGETAGVCDYRFVTENYNWRMLVNNNLAMREPMTNRYSDDYRDWAQALSGCSSQLSRSTRSSLAIVTAQHDIAQKLCAAGTQVLANGVADSASPEVFGPALDRLYQRALGRMPTDDERNAAITEMTACNAEGGENGCRASGHAALRWFCARLVDSAEFAVY
ncbi:MAG: DUF1549 domain-containing protein [Myxococcales bacterium]|nr:DUF1549 domain-containing protein [Myxococcales bacterium]